MTRLLTLLLLGLASAACSSSPATIEATADPESDLRGLLERADEAFDGRAYDDALGRYQAIHLAARSGGIDHVSTEAAAQTATILALRGDLEDSDRWMGLAESEATASMDSSWSRVLLARGVRAWKRGDQRLARESFVDLYTYCLRHGRSARAIQAANMAAFVSLGEDQLEWSLRAIEAAQAVGDPKWEAPLWTSHAWLLDDRGRYDDAVRAFERARDLTREADVTTYGRVQTDWAYAHGLRMVGRLEEARQVLDRASSVTQGIYVAKPTARAAEWLGRILWELGEVDAAEGDREGAGERLRAAREKLVEAGASRSAPRLLAELDERIAALDRSPSPRPTPRDL